MQYRIYVGWDPREEIAYRVLAHSAHRLASEPLEVHPLLLADLRRRGIYTRPTARKDGVLWDPISDAPMATEFSISRFFVPLIAGRTGWALFMDCDMLFRDDPLKLFALADDSKAVMVVKHPPMKIVAGETKMDAQPQTIYPRKNWSSVVLWNLSHPANNVLTPEMLNTVTGRDLHRFCWLPDELIGELPLTWNWLEGYSDPIPEPGPANVHHTRGGPWMKGWEHVAYGQDWWAEAGRLSLARRG